MVINLKKALEIAIAREIEAVSFYNQFAEVVSDKAVRAMLIDLAQEEEHHRQKLEEIVLTEIEADPGKSVDLALTDNFVAEPFFSDIPLQDLFIKAAQKEKQAAAFYSQLARATSLIKVKKLFLYLEEQEKSHKLRLELESERLFFPED
ncbi:MAG: hypothetical protein N3B16_11915 [Candidatus Aminicenantes bacterium]|nr:hypothetical protein [Candidatus Aminicenantes bacterium]